MSNFTAMGLVMALAIANCFIHFFLDRLIRDRADAVVTGVIRGVPVPTKHRWLVLHNSWFPVIAFGIIFEGAMSFGWIMLAGNASADEVQLFAYLAAFLVFVGGVLGFIAQGIVWYPRLASAVRQAEQS